MRLRYAEGMSAFAIIKAIPAALHAAGMAFIMNCLMQFLLCRGPALPAFVPLCSYA